MNNYEVKPITRQDWIAFYGDPPSHTAKGFSLWYQGELYGITGVTHLPSMYLWFSDTKDISDIPKKTVWRAIKEAYTKISAMGYPLLYAKTNPELSTADGLLKRLGFDFLVNDGESNVYYLVPKRISDDRCRNGITDRGDSS